MNELRDKLVEMGARSDDAERISKIKSRRDAATELLKIHDVRSKIKAGEKDIWKAEGEMKKMGIYYDFKG